MADNGTLPSPSENCRRQTPSLFSSPRLFTGFTSKLFLETETVISPTSTLDSKPFCCSRNQFSPETKRRWDKLDSKIGLGIVESLSDDDDDSKLHKLENKLVLFGSQMKIRIPPCPPLLLFTTESLNLTAGPGAETKKHHLGFLSPAKKSESKSSSSGSETPYPSRRFSGFLPSSKMELSEDYSCVISPGAIPRTTHIFEDCIVENGRGVCSLSLKENEKFLDNSKNFFPFENFLSFCFSCKKNLRPGTDIFMYRGEMAFCSHECRHEEMKVEEDVELEENLEQF